MPPPPAHRLYDSTEEAAGRIRALLQAGDPAGLDGANDSLLPDGPLEVDADAEAPLVVARRRAARLRAAGIVQVTEDHFLDLELDAEDLAASDLD